MLLAIVARYLDLTDEDLAILGPVMLILAGVVIRTGVFSPATVDGLLDDEDAREALTAAHPCPGCLRVTSREGRCLACGGGTTTQRGYGVGLAAATGAAAAAAPDVRVDDGAGARPAVGRPRTSTTSCRRSTAARTRRRTSSRCALGTTG